MKKLLLTSVKSHLKTVLTASFLVVGLQQANAQTLTYGTLYYGDPVGGLSNATTNAVLNILPNTGGDPANLFMKPVMSPTCMVADGDGNLAIGASAGNRVSRINKNATTTTIFLTGAAYYSLAIDKQNEYLYLGGANSIQRMIWADNGANTSVGYYNNMPAGTTTGSASFGAPSLIRSIPFLTNNDLVFFNNDVTASALPVGNIRGVIFDAAGNLFYADETYDVIRKIFMEKKTVATTAVASATTLELTDVSNIKVNCLVSGINIPASTYVTAINTATNTVTLSKAVTGGSIDNTASLAFVTKVEHVAGIYNTPSASPGATITGASVAGTTGLSLNATTYSVGLAFDTDGSLFLVDQAWQRILKIAATSGVVSATSNISEFLSGPINVTSAASSIAFDNVGKLYITRRSLYNVARTTATPGETETVIGSGSGRLIISAGTATAGSVTVTNIPAATVTALKVGMTLRSGTNFLNGTKVVAKPTSTSITISIPAISGAGSIANTIATTEDGFVSGIGALSVGSVDGPTSIVFANGNIYLAESPGNFVRVLTSLETLPVTISKEFTAKLNGSAVNLTWATAAEQNNNRFIVKRSTDGANYKEISSQPSKGDAGAAYATSDFNPANGDNYYELSQVDNDGKSKVLGVQVVKVALKEASFTIYPNPVQQGASFAVKTLAQGSNVVEVKISDVSGKLIYKQIFQKNTTGLYSV
ncbi:MAG: hypothetical protein EOP47_24170, partial [Sphingobacteriaceae bacterium]